MGVGSGPMVKSCPEFVKYFCFILPKDFCFLGQDFTIGPNYLVPFSGRVSL